MPYFGRRLACFIIVSVTFENVFIHYILVTSDALSKLHGWLENKEMCRQINNVCSFSKDHCVLCTSAKMIALKISL